MTPKEMTAKFREAFCLSGSPIAVIYRDEPAPDAWVPPSADSEKHVCALSCLRAIAEQGRWACIDAEHSGCFGASRYLGFSDQLREGFEFFLSYGIPGKLEGERYKKTPELVKEFLADSPPLPATGKYCILAPLEELASFDGVEAVAFLVTPDQLAGLFTLCNFLSADHNAVIAPFGAGCGTIIAEPRRQALSEDPKGVIGMFDPSARPCVPADALSFSAPTKLILEMAENIGESFVITETWKKVQRRIGKG